MKRTLLGICTALALTFSASSAVADEREDLVDRQEENQRRIEELQTSLEGVDVDLQASYLALEETRAKIPGAEAELATAQAELASALREQEVVAGQLDAANAELDTIEVALEEDTELTESTQRSLNELARSTYRGDNASSAVELWTGSSSTEDFLSGFSRVDSIARTQSSLILDAQTQLAINRNRQARQESVKDDIEVLQERADALVDETTAKEADAQAKRDALDVLIADEEAQAATLETQKADFQASLAQVEADQQSTAARIAEIDEENRRRAEEEARRAREEAEARRAAQAEQERAAAAARENSAPYSAPPAPVASAPANTMFMTPVPAPVYVTSPFGYRWHPIRGGRVLHMGVDLRSRCGEAQVAAAPGVVSDIVPASAGSGGGNIVYINHGIMNGDSYVTAYMHLSGFAVSRGQSVAKGQTVGYTGMTGGVTGCHVHFEIWKNGSVIDPMTQAGFTRRYS